MKRVYVAPVTDCCSLENEQILLETSQIPIGGESDHFDTAGYEWDSQTEFTFTD